MTPTPERETSKPSENLLLASSSLRGVRDGESYAALPATEPEVDAIADLFRASETGGAASPEIIPLRGPGATESEFRKLAENARSVPNQWSVLAPVACRVWCLPKFAEVCSTNIA